MISTPSMQQLLEAGVHFGHQVRRGHPQMKTFIYGERDGVHILDLAKSEERLRQAAQAAFDLGKMGKIMLLVGTKKQAKDIIESLAKETKTPYLTSRWLGGLLTNFEELRKNFKKLNDLEKEKDTGQLSRYTKKEQLLIDRKLKKFNNQFGGIADLEKIPDALFLIDSHQEKTAIKEAIKMGVLLIGLSDTNSDPTLLDYPIPANDDGIKSIKLIAETVIHSYGQGKKAITQRQETKPKKEKKVGEGSEEMVEEAAVIEEKVEKEIIEESSRKEGVS